jgi:hypothetical protein
MATSLLSSLVSWLSYQIVEKPGSSEGNPLHVVAAPGLMTLLDVALYRTVEGQLTATLTTSHALLAAWLSLQRQAVQVLEELEMDAAGGSGIYQPPHQQTRAVQMESLARACFEAACDAIAIINTDRLADSANLSDPYDSSSSSDHHHHHRGSVVTGVSSSQEDLLTALQESQLDTGRRRYPLHQRRRECWESPRLYCPDHVWADDVWQSSQRWLRQLFKHPFAIELNTTLRSHTSNAVANLSPRGGSAAPLSSYFEDNRSNLVVEQMNLLWLVLKKDLPTRLFQFRAAMEADAVVTKRLYLIKCEIRAPFRAFLESHHSVQRAPSLALVQEFSALTSPGGNKSSAKIEQRRAQFKEWLSKLLETPELVQALALEQRCEEFECAMAQTLVPFCELARYLEQKRARTKAVPGVLKAAHVQRLQDWLLRLRGLLVRKPAGASTGIRPLLLDLQGVPRDEKAALSQRLDNTTTRGVGIDMEVAQAHAEEFLRDLKTLGTLCLTRNAFWVNKKSGDLDLPTAIVRGCADLDEELFQCQFMDWCAMVVRQNELTGTKDFEGLAEKLRRAEMQMSLAVASHKSLEVVRQRLEVLSSDRAMRFEVLKAMAQEVCLREMNLHVAVIAPDRDRILPLPKTSALGVFGRALEIAGEPLPIG